MVFTGKDTSKGKSSGDGVIAVGSVGFADWAQGLSHPRFGGGFFVHKSFTFTALGTPILNLKQSSVKFVAGESHDPRSYNSQLHLQLKFFPVPFLKMGI